MMKKVWITLVATGALMSLPLSAAAAPIENVDIYYNDAKLSTTQPLENQNSRILLAFRDYFEGLSITVDWNESTRLATIDYEGKNVILEPDTGRIYVDGKVSTLDVKVQMVNERIYVPLRFLSEVFGATVYINAKDAPANYAQEKNGVTRILRKSVAPVSMTPSAEEKSAYEAWKKANTAYYINPQGQLTEVTTYDDQLSVLTIDTVKATEVKNAQGLGEKYATLGAFKYVDGHYQADFNAAIGDDRYLGVGTPIDANYLDYIDAAKGNFQIYRGQEEKSLVNIADDGTVSFATDTQTGYVLDTIGQTFTINAADYAVAADGSHGFIIDGELIIMDNARDVVFQEILSPTMQDCHIAAYKNKFVIMGVESGNSSNFYTAIYDTRGIIARGYIRDSNMDDASYAKIVSLAQQDDTIYVLLHSDWYNYLATIDVTNNTVTAEQLENHYQSIIPTDNGFSLFYTDKEYYYLEPIK